MSSSTPTPPAAITTRRIFFGGLNTEVSDADLRKRVQPFGTVEEATIVRDAEGRSRGFGYVMLRSDEAAWNRCRSVYNGTKWMSTVLRVEEAKPDYMARLRKEWIAEEAEASDSKKKKTSSGNATKKRPYAIVEENLTPLTDDAALQRPGWKKGRLGRAVAVMFMKPDGAKKIKKMDPSKFTENIKRLNHEPSERSVVALTWTYPEEDLERISHTFSTKYPVVTANATLSISPTARKDDKKINDFEYSDSGRDYYDDAKQRRQDFKKSDTTNDGDDDDIARSLRRERSMTLDIMRSILPDDDDEPYSERKKQTFSFEASDEDDENESDEKEDSDNDGDDEDNKNNEDDEDNKNNKDDQDEDNEEHEDQEEGEDEDDESEDHLKKHDDDEEKENEKGKTNANESLPDASAEENTQGGSKIVVNTNLRSLFFPGGKVVETPFFMMGKPDAAQDQGSNSFSFGFSSTSTGSISHAHSESETEKNAEKEIQEDLRCFERTMFFFHMDRNMGDRSLYVMRPPVFCRTAALEDIQREWEQSRQELTQEFKRKHKSVTKKRLKVMKRSSNKQGKISLASN